LKYLDGRKFGEWNFEDRGVTHTEIGSYAWQNPILYAHPSHTNTSQTHLSHTFTCHVHLSRTPQPPQSSIQLIPQLHCFLSHTENASSTSTLNAVSSMRTGVGGTGIIASTFQPHQGGALNHHWRSTHHDKYVYSITPSSHTPQESDLSCIDRNCTPPRCVSSPATSA
jgi:hypothetical protein